MEVRIARIDECPKPSHVIGFTITHTPSKRSLYLDAFVPLDSIPEEATEQDVVKKGWAQVKPAAENWTKECDEKSKSLVGTVIDPDDI